jgi:hypothetical protein
MQAERDCRYFCPRLKERSWPRGLMKVRPTWLFLFRCLGCLKYPFLGPITCLLKECLSPGLLTFCIHCNTRFFHSQTQDDIEPQAQGASMRRVDE